MVAAGGTVAALAARKATATIPIVILTRDDPLHHGFAGSINRPGGNVTGVVQLVLDADAKRLQILREILPGAQAVAFLTNQTGPTTERMITNARAAAAGLGLQLDVIVASGDDELGPVIAQAAGRGAAALLVAGDPYFLMRDERIVALAAEHALPAIYCFREFAAAGGLISFGSNLANAYYHVGLYTGRILNGAKPA